MTTTTAPATTHDGLLAAADLLLQRGLGRFPYSADAITSDPATGEVCLVGALQLAYCGDASPDAVDRAAPGHRAAYFAALDALQATCRNRYGIGLITDVSDELLRDADEGAELLRAAARRVGEGR